MVIGILNGYWSTNMGNSFFQLGAKYLIETAFPEAYVFFVGDQQGYMEIPHGMPLNGYDLVAKLKVDAIVVLGPFLRAECDRLLLPTVRELHRRGIKIIILGAGMMAYDAQCLSLFHKYMSEIKPDLFISRDRPTFLEFGKYAREAYDGICPAFFISDLWNVRIQIEQSKYVVWNFDQGTEPKLSNSPSLKTQTAVDLDGCVHYLSIPKWKQQLASMNRVTKVLWSWLDCGKYPLKMGNYDIIRTDHRFNPVFLRRIYSRPNTYCGDTPESYFILYQNARAVFSSRVHACAAALSFGREAMLFSTTPRAHLLDRVGAYEIRNRLVSLDMEKLDNEKKKMLSVIKKYVNK